MLQARSHVVILSVARLEGLTMGGPVQGSHVRRARMLRARKLLGRQTCKKLAAWQRSRKERMTMFWNFRGPGRSGLCSSTPASPTPTPPSSKAHFLLEN